MLAFCSEAIEFVDERFSARNTRPRDAGVFVPAVVQLSIIVRQVFSPQK